MSALPRTGGEFVHIIDLHAPNSGRFVLDFSHTALIGQFEHRVFNGQNEQIARFTGGIESNDTGHYPFRHGFPIDLSAGDYRVVSYVESPYFITPPGVFLEEESGYLQKIRIGNAIALIAMGVFISMGILYICFAATRGELTDLAYAVFIGGNLLFFSVSLNLLPELIGSTFFMLSSWPIFVSNLAYIVFVMSLLGIDREKDPALFRTGIGLIGLFVLFAIAGVLFPNWAIELCRVGVFLFLFYGLVAAVERVLKGDKLARFYLIANVCFMVPAAFAMSTVVFQNPTIYSSHIGVIAVATEVLLLSMVQSYRMNLINKERLAALETAEKSRIVARTDSLTGAPNRHAFEEAASKIRDQDSLTYIDLDGLKYYNDNFGHDRGDDLIRSFAVQMMKNLPGPARLYRIAGDEFCVISATIQAELVAACINQTVESLQASGYGFCGASYGQANFAETNSYINLKRTADARMYAMKESKKEALLSG